MDHISRNIELLAPAKNAEIAIEAVKHGADAVYMGADSFGARASATNSIDDIARVVDFAHRYLAKVYVTVNTILYDDEISRVEHLIKRLYLAGVDALIVQDMGVLRMDLPPIALHASTQCDIRTPEKALFLQRVGFSQLVLPREMTLDEIRAVRNVVEVPLEAFVHGALCVSYSGDCHASQVVAGRSANRGECAQICRLPYNLYDGTGNCLINGRHLLSLRDMNRASSLGMMIEAGVSSFKIEGRLKDTSYVKNVVTYYNNVLNRIVASSEGRYRRSSVGSVAVSFDADPYRSFNRGFTKYFLDSTNPKESMASIFTPKSQGRRVGVVKSVSGSKICADLECGLSNGDGLAYFDKNGSFTGFRLNKICGDVLYPASPVRVVPGTVLYRNNDKAFEGCLSGETGRRTVAVDVTLRRLSGGIAIDMKDERGCATSVSAQLQKQDSARSAQNDARRVALSKFGGTIYEAREVSDKCGDLFIPISVLNNLRRVALDLLDSDNRARYYRPLRRQEDFAAHWPGPKSLTYHYNVANKLALEFYRSHGVEDVQDALEIGKTRVVGNRVVMTTRYCLRRELGCCLKENGGSKLKGPLVLKSGEIEFRLDFDCAQCRMRVVKI